MAAAALALGAAVSAAPQRKPDDPTLVKMAPAVRALLKDPHPRGFILQLHDPVSTADLAALTHAGASIRRRYESFPMAAITSPGTALPRIAALDSVRRVSLDLTVTPASANSKG